MWGLLIVEAPLNALEHQITDHLAGDAVGGRDPGHHLTITGVGCKGQTNVLSVPAGDLEAVGRLAQVRADRVDLTVMRSAWRVFRYSAAAKGRFATSGGNCVCGSTWKVPRFHAAG